jgi:diguanylate cyclase (GGDEF)-like protein
VVSEVLGDVVSETTQRSAEAFVAGLAADLARSTSGVAFIYDSLDHLVVDYDLSDALLVLQTPTNGRQAFRGGRRPVRGAWALERAARSAPGLYTDPVILLPETAESLTNLCAVGLKLDFLAHDASHDALTGLLNRRSFDDLLSRAMSRSIRYGWAFTLVVLDLNRFKALNDQLGHPAGDEVLRAVGRGLRSFLRAGDVAARIGGDEFAVILDGTDPAVGRGLASRLAVAAGTIMGWAELGFAVGTATAPGEATDPAKLLEIADRRLYEAKVR